MSSSFGRWAQNLRCGHLARLFAVSTGYLLSADTNVRQECKKPKDVHDPEYDGDHHDRIQNGADGGRHGDEAVYQPQKNSDYYQSYDYLQ